MQNDMLSNFPEFRDESSNQISSKDLVEEISICEKELAKFPKNLNLMCKRFDLFIRANDFKRAYELARTICNVHPNSSLGHIKVLIILRRIGSVDLLLNEVNYLLEKKEGNKITVDIELRKLMFGLGLSAILKIMVSTERVSKGTIDFLEAYKLSSETEFPLEILSLCYIYSINSEYKMNLFSCSLREAIMKRSDHISLTSFVRQFLSGLQLEPCDKNTLILALGQKILQNCTQNEDFYCHVKFQVLQQPTAKSLRNSILMSGFVFNVTNIWKIACQQNNAKHRSNLIFIQKKTNIDKSVVYESCKNIEMFNATFIVMSSSKYIDQIKKWINFYNKAYYQRPSPNIIFVALDTDMATNIDMIKAIHSPKLVILKSLIFDEQIHLSGSVGFWSLRMSLLSKIIKNFVFTDYFIHFDGDAYILKCINDLIIEATKNHEIFGQTVFGLPFILPRSMCTGFFGGKKMDFTNLFMKDLFEGTVSFGTCQESMAYQFLKNPIQNEIDSKNIIKYSYVNKNFRVGLLAEKIAVRTGYDDIKIAKQPHAYVCHGHDL